MIGGPVLEIALLRHAPTDWNAARRLQGRTDVALSPAGRAMAGQWRLPKLPGAAWAERRWISSPLVRCRETAELMLRSMNRSMDAPPLELDDRLIERSFGDWEGDTLADLRRRYGAQMEEWEAKGWDFRPPGGESPRDVLQRSMSLLRERLQHGRDLVCVTHRSVLRALYAHARGWDMLGKPPEKLRDGCVHLFRFSAAGLEIVGLNQPLEPSAEAGAA